MCNLYRISQSAAEIAQLFNVRTTAVSNVPERVYPGLPGLVVTDDEVRSMVWGFPLVLKSKRSGAPLKPKPVNNARTDKLGGYFWRSSFEKRRCLIPVSAFAEAEGARGSMTKTWFTLPDHDTFACAGVWRDTDIWGPSFSMIMTDANPAIAPVHDRMPVILPHEVWGEWAVMPSQDAGVLCRPYAGKVVPDRTLEAWSQH